MYALLKKQTLTGILILGLFVLNGCGGGGGGNGGGTPPPGSGNPPPGGGQAATTPQADTFNWTGNTTLTVAAANGVLANDPANTVISAADTATTLGGVVNVDTATGAFTYNPPLGTQNVADTFTYSVSGTPVTVTVTLTERVWYVRNNDAGANQGNDQAPFLTLAQAGAASDANDTIFVFSGDGAATGQSNGITLLAGQKLIGEGVGLSVNGNPVVNAGANAVISNAGLQAPGDTPVVMLATGNEVAGLAINAAANEAILALNGTGHNVHNNTLTFDPANGREGVRLLNITGKNIVAGNTITGSPRDGIKLTNTEDQAGNPVAAASIVATVIMTGNTINNSAQGGARVTLDGAATNVTLNLEGNNISNSAANEGISIDTLGNAAVTAFVTGNAISLSGAVSDFRAAIAAASTSTMCVELFGNVNATTNSSFRVDNNSGVGDFRFFEGSNDTLATRIGLITDVARGTCGVPPVP